MKPPTKGISRELQVGLFIVTACAIVIAFSVRITDSPVFKAGTNLHAYFESAVGLYVNGKVKMAGISVGSIKKIELEDGKAKVTMLISKGYEIPQDAIFVPRALNIMGDKFIEIMMPDGSTPPKPEGEDIPAEGDSSGQLRKSSSKRVATYLLQVFAVSGALAQTPTAKGAYREGDVVKSEDKTVSMDDISRQLGEVTDDLKATSEAIRKVVEGEPNQKSALGRTLKNVERATKDITEITGDNKEDLRELVKSLRSVVVKVDGYLKELDGNKIGKDIQALASATGNLGQSIQHLESILAKVNNGDGTLGQLVNDGSIGHELNRGLKSVNRVLNRAQSTQTFVEIHPEYIFQDQITKTYAGLRLMPREDKGYLAQLVIDQQGATVTKETVTTIDGGAPVTTVETVTDRSDFRFNLQYYKQIWNWVFRLGLFENSGGLAVEYQFWDRSIALGSELFEIGREGEPYLKPYLRIHFLKHWYINGGWADALSPERNGYGAFTGLGLSLNDEDLGAVLGLAGLR